MVICELGNIPPHSVPVVIKEMAKYGEGEDKSNDSDEDGDSHSSGESEEDPF